MSDSAERLPGSAGLEPAVAEPLTQPDGRHPVAPPGMVRVTRTELVWPGKYNEDGTRRETPRVSLPFQVIERVNESRATREAKAATRTMSLFDVYEGKEGSTFEDGWRNKLIWGDNLLVMGSLLDRFAGKVDLIYIDPPFTTGADFSFEAPIGDGADELVKDRSMIEEKVYRDTWGRGLDSYLQYFNDVAALLWDSLAPHGSLYVHLDWRVSHYCKPILDELFGRDRLVNEIVWHYRTFQGQTHRYFAKKHDALLFYAKSNSFTFNEQFDTEFELTIDSRRWADYLDDQHQIVGAKMPIHDSRFTRYLNKWIRDHGRQPSPDDVVFEVRGQPVDSVWDLKGLDPKSLEKVGYPTQKPESVLARVISASSNESDLVLDCFCGSGTTAAVAEKLGRRWVGCDLSRWAIHVSRKRLLGIEGCKPFEILNLGKYERQYWQGVTFAGGRKITEQALYEYLAFILRLYGAEPISGPQYLHGKKARALVHIGSVDAPVTIADVTGAIDECVRLRQNELHVLGWEWEMGLSELMVGEAKKKGVKLLLLQIPREVMEQQAVDKGDIEFFELAYLDVEIETPEKLRAVVTLKDFVIPNTELIPDEVRARVTKWSDYVDYWAVDWDFQNDTFMHGWVTYRTRKDRRLPLSSDRHAYERPGNYTILVKVIDIFGNDTSRAFQVEVR